MTDADYLDAVFGASGFLAQRFAGYEPRAGQVALSRAVDAAIREGHHLLAEAPTGVGKSMAYSVPATYWATKRAEERRAVDPKANARVVIVTANIALQEQLIKKDLPLLAEILPWKFKYALLKGRQNYLCLEKFERGVKEPPEPRDAHRLKVIQDWAATTEMGDVSELPFEPGKLWNRFSVSSDECSGKDCEFYTPCYANRARDRAVDADVIVANYHLFFADFRVRDATDDNAWVLPDYEVAILDEGHKAADIARDFFGWRLSEFAAKAVGSMLVESFTKDTLEGEGAAFFELLAMFAQSPQYKARIKIKDAVPWQGFVDALQVASAEYAERINAELQRALTVYLSRAEKRMVSKLIRKRVRADEMVQAVTDAMQLEGDNVYFIEEDEEKRRVALCSKPISVAGELREKLFGSGKAVAITSATLAAGGNFDFVAGELGVDKPKTLVAQSPFFWGKQAVLITPKDVPEPNDPLFTQVAAEMCARTVELARGRTLGLFTSYRGLDAAHAAVLKTGYRVFRQGDLPRTKLIEEFKKDVNSVLLGTESFWAGVDVPGEALSCVFIDKLPFTPVGDPVLDALQERDRNCFFKYQVPRAVIAFKQGFGRLIRTTADRGVVVILDRRITTKGYGMMFIGSLPPVRRSTNLENVRAFLDTGELLPEAPPRAVGASLFEG